MTTHLLLVRRRYSAGVFPLMPADAEATITLVSLEESFGVGSLFPTGFLIEPNGRNDSAWYAAACLALKDIAEKVDGERTTPSAPEFTAEVFRGAMIFNGKCSDGSGGGVAGIVGGSWWSSTGNATKVAITYPIDIFSTDGQQWIKDLRVASAHLSFRKYASHCSVCDSHTTPVRVGIDHRRWRSIETSGSGQCCTV